MHYPHISSALSTGQYLRRTSWIRSPAALLTQRTPWNGPILSVQHASSFLNSLGPVHESLELKRGIYRPSFRLTFFNQRPMFKRSRFTVNQVWISLKGIRWRMRKQLNGPYKEFHIFTEGTGMLTSTYWSLSSRLQKVDRIIPDPTRAYTRSSSHTPSPPPLRNQIVNRNETPRTPRTPNSEVVWVRGPPSSISGSRGSRLRRTTTAVPTISSGVAKQRGGTETPNNGYRLPKIKRSESFSSPNMNGLGHSLKRAPSYGSVSARSIDSRMSIDDQKENILSPQSQLDIYPSSDDEEKTRSQKIKKQKVGEEKKVPLKAASSATLKPKSSKSNTKGNTRAKKVQPKKLIPSEFGAALPHPQPEPVPPPSRIELPPSSPLCPFLLDDEENTGFSTPISPVTPAKRLRRVKTANFPGVRRRISFGHLSTPIEDDREGEQSGSILGSAFRMH